MGSVELAANLFRITQTEQKIRFEQVRGQEKLESAAELVGQTVRRTMIELSGTPPERLESAEDIQAVKKRIRATSRRFRQIDRPVRRYPEAH
jgi:DNA-damage-inducible protein D